jgi:hypothetical protein
MEEVLTDLGFNGLIFKFQEEQVGLNYNLVKLI